MQPRLPRPAQSRPAPVRIDWARVRELAETGVREGRRVWSNLTADERAELWELVRRSGGNPRRLTRAETRRLGILLARAVGGDGRR